MSWTTYNAGQAAVDAQFIAADEMIGASRDLDSAEDRDRISTGLANYLETFVQQDIQFFSTGEAFPPPSVDSFRELQKATAVTLGNKQADEAVQIDIITAAFKDLAENGGKLLSVTNRVLPGIIIGLIVISGMLVAVFMGASLSNEERPNLLLGWVLVLSLALSAMVWIAHPFSEPLRIDTTAFEEILRVAKEYSGKATNKMTS